MELKIEKGILLISEPHLPDSNFSRSVVFIVEHNEQGTIGFVLNQSLGIFLSDAVDLEFILNPPLYKGGPCEGNTLHFLHTVGEKLSGSNEIIKGLFWGGNHEQLFDLMKLGEIQESQVKFFVGYSGWEPRQLATEIDSKSWLTIPAKLDFIFTNEIDKLWKKALLSKGKKYEVIANAPLNPNWN